MSSLETLAYGGAPSAPELVRRIAGDDPRRQEQHAAEEKRDRSLAAYHHYEVASAAVQIAIVLASAAIITGVMALAWIGGGLGLVAVAFSLIGLLAPTAVHLF